MRHALLLHPDSTCDAIASIEVEVERPRASALVLKYFVSGAMANVRLPAAAPSRRTDGLWRHTCFEAFVRAPPEPAYAEFNFAPSTQWAAYWFTGYRTGMSAAHELSPPRLEVLPEAESHTLQVLLSLAPLSSLPSDALWRVGLSAVIEETNGRLSYWALTHPDGKPDFHHPNCFTLELARASRA